MKRNTVRVARFLLGGGNTAPSCGEMPTALRRTNARGLPEGPALDKHAMLAPDFDLIVECRALHNIPARFRSLGLYQAYITLR
jgi:hypothetical protein